MGIIDTLTVKDTHIKVRR